MYCFRQYITKGILVILFITGLQHFTVAQKKDADSLLQIATTTGIDTVRIEAYLDAIELLMESNPDRGIQYGFSALAIAKNLKDSAWKAYCYQHIGICYDYKGNLDSCLYFLNASLAIHRAMNRYDRQSHIISDIAIAYYARGNYELALRNYLQSLDLRKAYGDKNYISKSLNNIGLLYKARKDYPNAIKYYQESIALKEELKDERGLVNTYLNIGSMYHSQHAYDSALLFAQKCLALAEKLGLTEDIAGAKGNISEALISMNRVEEAEKVLTESRRYAIASDCRNCMFTIYHGFGIIYTRRKEFTKALHALNTGLQMARTGKRSQQVLAYYKDLANCYRSMGNYRLALAYNDSAKEISHELLNEENIRQMNELTMVYESAEKEKQISELNAEKNISRTTALRRKRERNYLFISSLLFLALAVVAYRAYQSNKKKKELLNRQNKIIEQSLQDKEILLKEIHHRVKNNLQLISSLLSLQTDYIKDELALDAVKESRNRVHSMAILHQNLYQEENLTGIDMSAYIGKLCENLFHSYNIRPGKINLVKDIQPLQLDVEIVVPLGLILNELITNCLKYAFPQGREGSIKISLQEKNEQLQLFVYDNGVGIPADFNIIESRTFGFKMIHSFIQKMKGDIKIYSEDGTKVEIFLKNYKRVVHE